MINQVVLMGRLTRDPELRYTPQGSAVCTMSIAVNNKYQNKASGQQVEEVWFFDIDTWGRTAEVAAEYLKKGRQVVVSGKLKQERWESQDGKKMSRVKIVADHVEFTDSGERQGGGGPPADRPPGGGRQQHSARHRSVEEDGPPPDDGPPE